MNSSTLPTAEGEPPRRIPSPSEFMRGRRPELFSDSVSVERLVLERSRLEFHLDSMTSRSEEKQFEHYCRQLCERLICPSLRPQTGPTGGGDSKVDGDSHPVAQRVSERWWVGDAEQVGASELAFAFSTKKDWATKVRADVASAVGTGRPYQRIYFVTNQAVPDKRRGKMEDELRKKHRIPVTILDRTWLIEKTLAPMNMEIAISTLGMKDLERERRKSVGPQDLSRQRRLQELERRIADEGHYGSAAYQLVEDVLEAALLRRSIGSSREDVQAAFDRAMRIAARHGVRLQRLRARYLSIWTLYWWFDDVGALRDGFLALERDYGEDASVWDLAYIVNLDIAVEGSCRSDGFVRPPEHLAARTRVRDALEVAASRRGAATQSAWARTLLVFLGFLEDLGSEEGAIRAVDQLRQLLEHAKSLPEYPTESLLEWISVTLEIAPAHSALLELADDLATAQSARAGVAAEVGVRVRAAEGHLERDAPYDALEQLGRAQVALAAHQDIDEQASLWCLCAVAYEQAGLLWAARSCLICAVSSDMRAFLQEAGAVPRRLRASLRELLWCDIRLGQMPTALAWSRLRSTIRGLHPEESASDVRQSHEQADMALQAAIAVAVLRSSDADLERMQGLAEVLRVSDAPFASEMALVRLGHADDMAAAVGVTEKDVLKGAAVLLGHAIEQHVPRDIEWRLGERVQLSSSMLGCRLLVQATAYRDCVLFAEALLGFLEALLAVGMKERVWGTRDVIHVNVRKGSEQESGMTWSLPEDDCGEIQLDIEIRGSALDLANQQPGEWMRMAVDVAVQILHFPDRRSMEKLLMPGSGSPDRAVSLVHVPVMIHNLLDMQFPAGPHWFSSQLSRLPPDLPLHAFRADRVPRDALAQPPSELEDHDGDQEGHGFLSHRNLSTSGLVNGALWDRARWRGFMYLARGDDVPLLGILFQHIEPGLKIFRGWRKRLGLVDENERLLLGGLVGTDRHHPLHYRAVISGSLTAFRRKGMAVTSPARLLDVEPEDHVNLNTFLEALRQHHKYLLVPVHLTPEGPRFDLELGVEKSQFHIEQAWKVAVGDDLMLGVAPHDDPVIPAEETDPPIAEVFRLIRSGSSTRIPKRPRRTP